MNVADLQIHRLVEFVHPYMKARDMFPALSAEALDEHRAWLQPHALDANDVFVLSYHGWLVRTPHHLILVDSCVGNHKEGRRRPEWNRRNGDGFLRALAAAGFAPEDVDYVMCTHLHVDHVGWNTQLVNGRWVPTFPNARYVFHRDEHAWWESENRRDENPVYVDSVLPVVELGRADLVENDFALGDHVRILPTPGHTAGHSSFCFGRSRDDAVIAGDLIHVPLQMRLPDLAFVRDENAALAARTRRAFLERYCETSTLCCMAHFPTPSMGRIVRWGNGFRLDDSMLVHEDAKVQP